jgi:hypothetical protein
MAGGLLIVRTHAQQPRRRERWWSRGYDCANGNGANHQSKRLRHAGEAVGIEFIDENGGGASIRLRKPQRGKAPSEMAEFILGKIFKRSPGWARPIGSRARRSALTMHKDLTKEVIE